MRRLALLIATVGLLGAIGVMPAAADVARHQVTTKVYDLQVGYGHTFTIEFGCDSTLAATGYQNIHNPDEQMTATLSSDGTTINISSVYVGGWAGSPYSWVGGFPVAGGQGHADSSDGAHYVFPVLVLSTLTTSYRNHGAYVTAAGGGDDAAHSCIGKPIISNG